MSGWYAVKRGLLEHDLFAPKGEWSRAEAWLWMMDNACFAPTKIDIGGKPYVVPRGALCYSRRFLSAKWRWSRKAVDTFLSALERHGTVTLGVAKTGTGTKSKRSLITLCNYEKYQSVGAKTEPKGGQKGAKEEQGDNIPVGKGADAPSADPAKLMFDSGIALLTEGGTKESHARSMIGKWRKDHGTAAVIEAISRAKREGAIDPLEFITGIFKHQRKSGQIERPGYTHGGAFGMIPERN